MANYELQAQVALMGTEYGIATGLTQHAWRRVLGQTVMGELTEFPKIVFTRRDTGAMEAADSIEWLEQDIPERAAAIAERVALQEAYEPYAPLLKGLDTAVRQRGALPEGFTRLGKGNFATAYSFPGPDNKQLLVARRFRTVAPADRAGDTDMRIAGLIASHKEPDFEQAVAFSYKDMVITEAEPGVRLSHLDKEAIETIDEDAVNQGLDAIDAANANKVALDDYGWGNVLYAKELAFPFRFIDVGPATRYTTQEANFLAFARELRGAGTESRVRGRDALLRPILEKFVESYIERYPHRYRRARSVYCTV